MMDEPGERLYADLAWLWPLWGTPAEYEPWCDHVVELIRRYARREVKSLLNLGCGGGKNAFNLKRHFEVTGLDRSRPMLALAETLNPDCAFVTGDMRNFDLGRRFDAILIDDAVAYMTSRADLAALFATAYQHLRPGGIMVVSPDETTETFRQNQTRVTYANPAAKPAGVEVTFIENDFDPDPGDDTYESVMIYLIRRDGRLQIETDIHTMGLFPIPVWRYTLEDAGFELFEERYLEEDRHHITFASRKPEKPT